MGTKARVLYAASIAALACASTSAVAATANGQSQDQRLGLISPQSGNIDAFTGNIDAFNGNIDAFSGNIDAFWGNIDAFYGNIDAFYGNIDAFWGNIDAFTGNIDAFTGNIDAFTGNIDAFYGNIDAFTGNIDAFYGNIDAFWGNIDAFMGNIDAFTGNIDAFTGNIDAFSGNIDAFWGNIDAFWGNIDAFGRDSAETQGFADFLNEVIGAADGAFGETYNDRTGQDFMEDFIEPLLDKYYLQLDAPNTLLNKSEAQRRRFLLELYDGMMLHNGVDMADHWMPSINWSPVLSHATDAGSGVTVGLLDTPIVMGGPVGGNVGEVQGYGLDEADHGAGVASVIGGAHDGYGVMGIAPATDFKVYNPFDETLTTNWVDVVNGVQSLASQDVNVINMSMGVEGFILHKDWRQVLQSVETMQNADNIIFVKAAGNNGREQRNNVEWRFTTGEDRLLIVGSVGPDNEISPFSNTPGEACLTQFWQCNAGDELKYRFLVAPGEVILVQDNENNVSRATGTSLAAPMVTGAIALLQSRWPWLQDHAETTADIILQTATDLGDPGVDEVYGWGLLNVGASQSPIDPGALYIQMGDQQMNLRDSTLGGTLLGLIGNAPTVTAFEDIGETYRDFQIELTDLDMLFVDPDAAQAAENEGYLNRGLGGMGGALGITNSLAGTTVQGHAFDQFSVGAVPVLGGGNSPWTLKMMAETRDPLEPVAQGDLPFTTGMTLENDVTGMMFKAGAGRGVFALSPTGAFRMDTDYEIATGGVNPFLGFASGDAYAATRLPVADKLSLTFGFTQNRDDMAFVDQESGELLSRFADVNPYQAQAATFGTQFQPNEKVTIAATATQLEEESGLYGAQGTGLFAMNGGASTTALSMDISASLTPSLNLHASGTTARTTGLLDDGSALSLSDNGLRATSYQVALEAPGFLGTKTNARLSFAQPLHVTGGDLLLETTGVVDRSTGALGLTQQTIDLTGGGPRYVSEALIARPLMDGQANISAFGQYQTRTLENPEGGAAVAGGVRFTINFK